MGHFFNNFNFCLLGHSEFIIIIYNLILILNYIIHILYFII